MVVFMAMASAAQAAEKPNILFIIADDLCYQNVHALGCDEIETPNLDRLVSQGLNFSHAYNPGSWSGAVCVASRTMLNTGRFLWQAQAIYKTSEEERQAGRFWSEYMRKAGYETYFTGKWHVKANAEKAFDHATHVRPGMPNQTPEGYNRPVEGQPDAWSPWDTKFEGYWKGGKHWSEVVADDADQYFQLASQRDEPFFMYLAFNAPHDPRQSPKQFVDQYPVSQMPLPENYLSEYPYKDAIGCGAKLRDERLAPFPRTPYAVRVNRQEYYALITHMDRQIGRLLDALEKSGKADQTYVFFTADHGLGVGQHGLMGKQNMYDHSVRVPFVVKGPGIPAGQSNDTPIYLQDVMPTTLELAGVDRPDHVQFKSLMPLLRGQPSEHYDAIYGAYLQLQRMVTMDGFKLILYPDIGRARLFQLASDPHEMHDLADEPKYQATKKRLFKRLLQLQKDMADELDLQAAFPELAS
jgi:choline-sulfatase